MKDILRIAFFSTLFVPLIFIGSSVQASAQNSINGMIFDEKRKPVGEIEVELLDEYERLIRTTKTKGSGLYVFPNMRQGSYYIRVRTAGTGYQEKAERVEIGSTNRTDQLGNIRGIEVIQLNIYLQLDPRYTKASSEITGAIFTQEVPGDARKAFESAEKSFHKKDLEKSEKYLLTALDIFPDYFDSLEMLGNVYLKLGRFPESEQNLSRAADINRRSFSAHFSLGTAQYKQKKFELAIRTLTRSIENDPTSVGAYTLLGISQREVRQYEESEKSLLKADELSNQKEPDVHWNLALLYFHDLKKYNEAADHLEYFLKVSPKAPPEKVDQVKKLIKTFREKTKSKN